MSLASVLLIACLAAEGDDVKTTMRGNLAAAVALQPLIASPRAFADPANAATVSNSLKMLARTRHQFHRPDAQEPAAAMAELFAEAVGRAQADVDAGRVDAARLRLRGLTGLCLSCHSRQLATPAAAVEKPGEASELDSLERAQFLAATRQFDAALAIWEEALTAPCKTDEDAFVQAQALRAAMSVSVRAKDDPAATVAMLKKQAARTDLAPYLRPVYASLLADAKAWQAEKLTASKASPDVLYQRAGELIQASGAFESLFPRDAHRVKLLRATAYLSLALERQPNAKWRGEALYRLGVAMGAMLDPDLWELDALYLEACVRENAHSTLALRCIDRLSERTWFGYTGSGGTRLPPDVAAQLERLRSLAKP